jgi:polysaccharide biosynthesis protein PslH
MNILFMTARLPYPPLNGDKVIPYNRLKLLSSKHTVTLLSFYQNDRELEYLDHMRQYCEQIIAIKQNRFISVLNLLRGLYSGQPFQVLYFSSGKMRKEVRKLLKRERFDIVHTYMIRMAEYAQEIKEFKVLELIDPMELNYRQRMATGRYWLRAALKAESKRLGVYERGIVDKYDVSILVSEKDAEAFHSDRVVSLSLGVDTDIFQRAEELPNNRTIVFSGNMGYGPNENAILWFLENCYPMIKTHVADAKLIIAGYNPSLRVRSFHDGVSVCITGFVESMSAVLCGAQLAITPMQSGYGMHIKLLEAMACGLPVVTTSLALGSIKAVNGREVAIADDGKQFIDRCIELLQNYKIAQKMGNAARKLIKERYSWKAHVSHIEEIYEGIVRKGGYYASDSS